MRPFHIPIFIKTRLPALTGKRAKIVVFPILILFVFSLKSPSAEIKARIIVHGPKAQITQLKGGAFLHRKHLPSPILLKFDDFLRKGDNIHTTLNSRLEIRFSDDSYMRFDQNTDFRIDAIAFDKKTGVRDIAVHLIQGKAWANSSLLSGSGFFSISTQNTTADTNGTVMRVTVKSDGSSVVKVYQGEMVIKSLLNSESEKTDSKKKPGLRSVTQHAWTHIIRSMQQMIVYKDGNVTKPFRFTIKADENRWVQWNRQQDRKVGNGFLDQ